MNNNTDSTSYYTTYYITTSIKSDDNLGIILGSCIVPKHDPSVRCTEILNNNYCTSNSIELYTILKCLTVYKSNSDIYIYSTSLYTVNCVNEWLLNYEKKNWKKYTCESSVDVDLLDLIVDKVSRINITGRKVLILYTSKSDASTFNKGAHAYVVSKLYDYIKSANFTHLL